MSRRHAAEKRPILNDPKYGDPVITKFTNAIMLDGKKSVAERLVYGAFDVVQSKTGQDPVKVFHEALDNVKPAIEVRSRRVGGATYQVPVEVRADRRQALAIRWIVDIARRRSEGNPRSESTKWWRGPVPSPTSSGQSTKRSTVSKSTTV